MQRKYTDEVYFDLVDTIAEINRTDFSWITDTLGDLGSTFASWVGLLSIDRYLDDVSKYHRKVLDQHDTTEEELAEIFRAVDAEDLYGAQALKALQESAETYSSSMNDLAAMLSPGAEFTASAIRSNGKKISSDLEGAADRMNEVYDEQLVIRQKMVAKDAAKELIGDIFGAGLTILSLPVQMASGDWVGAVSSGYKLINSVFTTGEDLVALSTVGIVALMGVAGWGNNDSRYWGVNEADRQRQKTGLADEIEEAGWKGGADAVRVLDTVNEAYGLFKGITGAYKTITTTGKILTSDIYTDQTKFEYIISEVVRPNLGIGNTDYDGSTVIGQYQNTKGTISTIQHIYNFVDTVADPDKSVPEYFYDQSSLAKVGKDTSDLIDHTQDRVDKIFPETTDPLARTADPDPDAGN